MGMGTSEFADVVEQPHLVWVRSLRGRSPEKWVELDFGQRNWKKPFVIAFQQISDAEWLLPLDYLADRYPPEKCKWQSKRHSPAED